MLRRIMRLFLTLNSSLLNFERNFTYLKISCISCVSKNLQWRFSAANFLTNKISVLDQNDNAAIDGDKYIMLIQQTAIETGHPIPKLEPDPIDPNEVIANTQPAKR